MPAFMDDLDEIDIGDFVEDGDNGSKVLQLEYPFSVTVKEGGNTQTETVKYLEFRRPLGRDMDKIEQMAGSAMKGARSFVAGLVIVPVGINANKLGDLDAADMMRAMKVCFDFFPKGRSGNTGAS
ncbi:hypothetical protein [Thalassospira sp. MCCC 1A01428]|uniref:hypothetical protein n=1 Tax=unclassified Thalassospira TaxID=2648997 RepID=UPI000A1ECBF6|nr:hypothetical protein [Thalassospira sp. MCCC 1A01428]OSQ39205.1 hypothetical protein THS27_21110 [Thalassospira sp. MCCC 1A01428]